MGFPGGTSGKKPTWQCRRSERCGCITYALIHLILITTVKRQMLLFFLLLEAFFFFLVFYFFSCFRCRVRLFIWLFFLFLEVCLYCYELSSKHCFYSVPQVLGCCVFIFIHFYAYFDFFFYFFCDLLVIQKRVVQPPYVGIFNIFFSCNWDLILMHYGQKRCLGWFRFFWIYHG